MEDPNWDGTSQNPWRESASHISALSSQRNRWLGPFLRHFVHFICCFQPEACVKCVLLSLLDNITKVKWKDFVLDPNSVEIVYWSRASSQLKSILVSQIADLPHGASWCTETFVGFMWCCFWHSKTSKFSVWNGLKSGLSTFPSWVELLVWGWQEKQEKGNDRIMNVGMMMFDLNNIILLCKHIIIIITVLDFLPLT